MKTGPVPFRPTAYYHSLPKVDLHRHLEGSLRLQTLLQIGRALGMPLGTGKLRDLVQIQASDNLTFENFLSKFQTLRLFYRSPEAIYRITHEAIQDAAQDNLRYLELRFTPVALSRAEKFPLNDVINWVTAATKEASQKFGLPTRLIASVNRQEPLSLAEQVIQLAVDYQSAGIVGIDLAGNEAEYPGREFASLFQAARQAGLHITAHAGEWGGASNVKTAIEELGAERIGHGVRILEDPQVVKMARHCRTTFEVCITSNYQSGVFSTVTAHPFTRMHNLGLNVTINTDDPSISQIVLSDEYRLATEEMGISNALLRERILAAAQASFLPQDEKERLVSALRQELDRAS